MACFRDIGIKSLREKKLQSPIILKSFLKSLSIINCRKRYFVSKSNTYFKGDKHSRVPDRYDLLNLGLPQHCSKY